MAVQNQRKLIIRRDRCSRASCMAPSYSRTVSQYAHNYLFVTVASSSHTLCYFVARVTCKNLVLTHHLRYEPLPTLMTKSIIKLLQQISIIFAVLAGLVRVGVMRSNFSGGIDGSLTADTYSARIRQHASHRRRS